MKYEIKDCIDAGTEFCPCHLAETGDCIVCSQLGGKNFCDCRNWKGVCIYQEYVWNGNKAKEGRKNNVCRVLKKELRENRLIIFTILVPHKLSQDLNKPGSFVFLRHEDCMQFYDTPISIMEANTEENWIKVAIEIKGIKTKMLNEIKEDERILVRGPFFNGILGLKHVEEVKDGIAVIICRGIGMAPMVPALKKLYGNGNKIVVIMDKAPYKEVFIQNYLDMCNATVISCNSLQKGELSDVLKSTLKNLLELEYTNIKIIHCDGPDILISRTLNYINDLKTSLTSNIEISESKTNLDKIWFTSCNNAKMCCGEGVCGTCSVRYKGQIVKKLCKVQSDPEYIFEGRRLI